jgi:hypothetical protein
MWGEMYLPIYYDATDGPDLQHHAGLPSRHAT